MPGLNKVRSWNRCLVAACLALLFSFGSLAPLAAQSFSSAPAGMACCRTKGKSCCSKNQAHHSTGGPVFSALPCSSGGCLVSLGGVAIAGFAMFRVHTWEPATEAAAVRNSRHLFPASALALYNLQQRPPPSIPVALLGCLLRDRAFYFKLYLPDALRLSPLSGDWRAVARPYSAVFFGIRFVLGKRRSFLRQELLQTDEERMLPAHARPGSRLEGISFVS